MALRPLYILNAVDVRRATVAGSSRANTVAKFTIPPIKRQVATHNPGGGVGEVDFTLNRIEKLEPAFEAKGIDEEVFAGMGERSTWTFASSYRDTTTNVVVPARGIIEGVVSGWEPDASDPKEFQGCNHMFAEVTHFEFLLNNVELIYWDFQERVARFKGKDIMAADRLALGA